MAKLEYNIDHRELMDWREVLIENSDEFKDHTNLLRDLCYGLSFMSGWHTDLKTGRPKEGNKLERLMLIVSEVAEACEGVRKGINDDHLPNRLMEEVELADVIIRVFDYAGKYNLDLGGALVEKLTYNQNREDHKIENRIKDGGKKV